jgi:chromosome segregation ATPase
MAAAVPLIFCAAYFSSSLLVSDRAAVVGEADRQLERARRLLIKYSHNKERLASILADLERHGVNIAPDPGEIEPLLETDRSLLEEANEELRTRARDEAAVKLRELEERFQAAGGSAEREVAAPATLGGSLAQMSRTVADALLARNAIVEENKRILDEALGVVDQALSVARGDVSGDAHPQASRLKGIILMAQAGVDYRQAVRLRERSQEPRRRFLEVVAGARQLAVEQTLAEQSGVRERLATLRMDADEIRGTLADLREERQTLDGIITDLERRITSARDKAQEARTAMEELHDEGVDLLATDGFKEFAAAYSQLAQTYRQGIAEAHRLEFGTLRNAHIDETGDYLRGEFIPEGPDGKIVVQRGLVAYTHDRAVTGLSIKRYEQTLEDVEASISEFDSLLAQYEEAATEAAAELERVREQAASAYRMTLERSSAGDEAIKQAARKARGAVTALRSAVQAANNYTRSARDRISGASPAAQERSPFKLLSEDDWISGQATNELAQAYYLLATILAHQHETAEEDRIMAVVARSELGIDEADPDGFAATSEAARGDAVEAARDAVRELEKSGRDLNNNWTVAAQAGAAHYLLAVLENPAHLETALANYQAAVQNREDDPFAHAIVDRKDQLQDRVR